ncbi:MAG TPA: hypothetical protein VFC36_01780 [Paludibacter sp.]|nr:hypothetical protein [Paludibacter sp.]
MLHILKSKKQTKLEKQQLELEMLFSLRRSKIDSICNLKKQLKFKQMTVTCNQGVMNQMQPNAKSVKSTASYTYHHPAIAIWQGIAKVNSQIRTQLYDDGKFIYGILLRHGGSFCTAIMLGAGNDTLLQYINCYTS